MYVCDKGGHDKEGRKRSWAGGRKEESQMIHMTQKQGQAARTCRQGWGAREGSGGPSVGKVAQLVKVFAIEPDYPYFHECTHRHAGMHIEKVKKRKSFL